MKLLSWLSYNHYKKLQSTMKSSPLSIDELSFDSICKFVETNDVSCLSYSLKFVEDVDVIRGRYG